MILRLSKKLIRRYFQRTRIFIYSSLSNNAENIVGNPIVHQPVLFLGKGTYHFKSKVNLGYFPSPFFYNGNIHLEARLKNSKIEFGSNVFVNNNFVAVCLNSIKIGDNVLIGTNVEIFDSDFHNTEPIERFGGKAEVKEVIIHNNVWIGSNVKILKGVTIGENSVISNGSIVTKSIPRNVIAAGVPAKVIKEL